MSPNKLPAVITSLDSTLYHRHQQGFFTQIQAESFYLFLFSSGLISSKYSIFPIKILNNNN